MKSVPSLATTMILLLVSSLLLPGCLHIRLHTSISPHGRAWRLLDVSVDAQYRPQLESLNTAEAMAAADYEGWDTVTYMKDGRFHWKLTRVFRDVEGVSDHLIQMAFGRWVKLGDYQEGDAVDFDLYRRVSTTTYTFNEAFRIQPNEELISEVCGQQFPPAQVEVAVDMPGKLLDVSDAAHTSESTALWRFSVGPEDTGMIDKRIQVKSGHSNALHHFLIGSLAILFILYLPRQFVRLRHTGQDGPQNEKTRSSLPS